MNQKIHEIEIELRVRIIEASHIRHVYMMQF